MADGSGSAVFGHDDDHRAVADEADIRTQGYDVLSDLSAVLYDLYDAASGNISHDQFARLAERIMEEKEYGIPKVKRVVVHEVEATKNATPEDEWEAYCEGEIKASLELIKEMKFEKVFRFLGRDKTMIDNPAGLGRYLWSVRDDISIEDLSNLIELLYRIAYLGNGCEQQAADKATTEAAAEA